MNTTIKYVASLSNTVLCLADYTPPKVKRPAVQSINDAPAETEQKPKAKREKITSFSPSSCRRLVKYTREIPKKRFTGFVTLTYPEAPENIADAKEHINQFLEYMRRFANSLTLTFSALWVMEFQERGAVHFHVWTNAWIPKNKITKAWNRIIDVLPDTPSTNVRAWKAYSKSGLSSYVAKYAKKQQQKELPKGINAAGRWWGKIGDTSTPLAIKTEITKAEREEIKTLALNEGWKEIESDWCRVWIVEDSARHLLFVMLEKIKKKREIENENRKID